MRLQDLGVEAGTVGRQKPLIRQVGFLQCRQTTDKPLTILKTIAKPGTSSTGSNVQFQVRFNFGRGYEQQATVI